MNKQQLLELLSPSEHEKIYIPNEIFIDFLKIEKNAFAYCYYCLVSYLYRYSKYGQGKEYSPGTIKEILGYAANYKPLDLIIKKDGLLDQSGYTRTVRDFPIWNEYSDDGINLEMYSDLDEDTKRVVDMPKNFRIKEPVKGLYRTEEGILDGTFYEIENTHLFNIQEFIDMMSNNDLGVSGFYIYQYIKYKNNIHIQGYNIGREQLEKEINIPERTMREYIKRLEHTGYIQVIRNENKGVKTAANIYRVKNVKSKRL